MKTFVAVAICSVAALCGFPEANGQVYYYPRIGRGLYRYREVNPEIAYGYRAVPEDPEIYRYRRNGDAQGEPETEVVQVQPIRLRSFGSYQPDVAVSASNPQPAFRQTGLPLSDGSGLSPVDRADFIESKGYKHHKGHVGPVYTFVKTDYDANFKWGVRHVAGKEYGKK